MSKRLDTLSAPTPGSAIRRREINAAWREIEGSPAQIRRETAIEFNYIEGNDHSDFPQADDVASMGSLQTGLKDCARVARRKASGMKDGKGRIACLGPQYGAELVAIRDIPLGTAVRVGVEGRMAGDGVKPIKRSRDPRIGLEIKARKSAAGHSAEEQAIRELNRSFGAGYATREDLFGGEDLGEDEIPDAATLCQEQSRAVAGDGAIIGDELVDKVREGRRRVIVVSLDELEEAELEAEADDYAFTRADQA